MSFDINALREKRNRLASEAYAALPKDGAATPDQLTKFDSIMAEADAVKSTIERAERAAALEAELRAVNPISLPNGATISADEQRAKDEFREKAFNKFLKLGDKHLNAKEAEEVRNLGVTSGNAGAYLIPQGFEKTLEDALKFYGGMRKVATIQKTDSGAPIMFPTSSDITVGALLNGGTAVEQDPSFGQIQFGAYTYTTQAVTIGAELLQDSAFDLTAWLAAKFVDRIGRIQNTHFTTYNNAGGVLGPQGIVPFAVAANQGVAGVTGETATITFDNLLDLIHSLDIAYRDKAKFMFHDTTLAAIRKLKDNYGRYLLDPGVNGGDADKIWGYSYQVNQDMPTLAANDVSVLFGDFSKYVIRDVTGLQIKRSDDLLMLKNQVVFVGFQRTDARGLDAGTHPISTFTNSAS